MRVSPKMSLSGSANSRQQSNTSARDFIIMKPHQRGAEELDGEKSQVKRLKDEIRRFSTQKPSQNLDSTYVASSRVPLQERPIGNVGAIY